MPCYAYFITPHGYGHAARACAVINALSEQQPDTVFEIFTRVPVWFFNMSLQANFHYNEVLTDIGLVQSNAMDADLNATIHRLDELLPYRPELVSELARRVRAKGCQMVICDIAPLGIAVAREAGLPSVLTENFTWDWIYEEYEEVEPRFTPHIRFLREMFAAADYHIRTEPACTYDPPADLLTQVVSRKPRTAASETRQRLGVEGDMPVVMITMGGIVTQYPFLDRLVHAEEMRFLIPGGSPAYEQRGSLVLIPHHSDFYHPDLVEASNVIVGKLGYSTLAEAYAAGLPFAFVPRQNFRESPPMARFAREGMGAEELPEERFFSGEWLDMLPDLLARPRVKPTTPNGADVIARYLLEKQI